MLCDSLPYIGIDEDKVNNIGRLQSFPLLRCYNFLHSHPSLPPPGGKELWNVLEQKIFRTNVRNLSG